MKGPEEEGPDKNGSVISLIAEGSCLLFIIARHILRASLAAVFGWLIPIQRKNLSSAIVLITGGGRGLGRSLAIEFAKYKPKEIILWGRNEDNLAATASAVRLHDVPCAFMTCDVSKSAQVLVKAKEVREKHGIVTIIVNNAGIVFRNNTLGTTDEEVEQILRTNTFGQIQTVRAFLPDMISRNHGHIVSINSMLGLMSLPGLSHYVASKYALTGFHQALTSELQLSGKTGVHTTSVHTGILNTDMFAGYAPRFSNLVPPLDKTYVAEKTVDAVLSNQTYLVLPRLCYWISLTLSFFPAEAMIALHKFLRLDQSMDEFSKRQKRQ